MLSDPVAVIVASTITAIATGGPTLLIARRRPGLRARRPTVDAWQRQAKELDELLRQQYERQISDRDKQIEDLRRDLAAARQGTVRDDR